MRLCYLRERPEFQHRQQGGPLRAIRDIWGNPHARLLITVTFIENVGSAAIAALTLYVSQYVVGAPAMAPLIILAYMVPSSLFVPIWIPLSKRFGKIKVWMAGMVLTALSFGGMFFLPFIESLDQRLFLIIFLAVFAGLANGCGGTLGPSVQGDVMTTMNTKRASAKKALTSLRGTFVYKSALGVMLLLTGFVLDFAGFVPNVEQTMQVKLAMVACMGFSHWCVTPLVRFCSVVLRWMKRPTKRFAPSWMPGALRVATTRPRLLRDKVARTSFRYRLNTFAMISSLLQSVLFHELVIGLGLDRIGKTLPAW